MSLQRMYRPGWAGVKERFLATFGSRQAEIAHNTREVEKEAWRCQLCGAPADFQHASPTGTGYVHWSGACFAHRTYLLNHHWTRTGDGAWIDAGAGDTTCTCHGQPYGECARTARWKNSHLDGAFYAILDGERMPVSHTVLLAS